jgi:hypothetical protein
MNLKWLIVFILLFFSSGCKQGYYTHQVNCLESTSQTISLRCTGIGKDRYSAINDAEKAAFNTLLFKGVPSSQQKDALISYNESECIKENNKYFNNLFSKGHYKTFITTSVPVSELTHCRGTMKMITVDVQINIYSLRKDLEQNNIIRAFGY